jgi:hypothetical protein
MKNVEAKSRYWAVKIQPQRVQRQENKQTEILKEISTFVSKDHNVIPIKMRVKCHTFPLLAHR